MKKLEFYKLEFYKLEAAGNDFILIDGRCKQKLDYKTLAKKVCQRKLGPGADGLLVIEPSKKADFKMRIFNADGSEAEMCGNGARCVALYSGKKNMRFDTIAGIIEAQVKGDNAKIKISSSFGLKLNIPLKVLGRNVKVNFINTGVPHAIIFVEGLDKIDINNIGRAIRFHKKFKPRGTNVNFVEIKNYNSIKIRTYERGVEAETLACGTGAAASAIIAHLRQGFGGQAGSKVVTKSGETLKVSFNKQKNKISNVWLEGRAHLVYKGEIC